MPEEDRQVFLAEMNSTIAKVARLEQTLRELRAAIRDLGRNPEVDSRNQRERGATIHEITIDEANIDTQIDVVKSDWKKSVAKLMAFVGMPNSEGGADGQGGC